MKQVDAIRLAWKLMKEHNVEDWGFEFDRAKNRFGCCHHDSRKITLSKHFVEKNSEELVTQTILHEIAHALVGGEYGHGKPWKRVARLLGYSGNRCCSNEVELPNRNYEGTCPSCGRIIHRHRRRDIACGECCNGKYNKNFKFKWRKV